MTYSRDEIPMIADEYVIGLLDAAEAAKVEIEVERDAALRAAIAASRERFLPLDSLAERLPTDETLWQRIEAALPAQAGLAHKTTAPAPANDNSTARRWKPIALSAMAASLLLAVSLSVSLLRTQEPLVVAVLLNEAGEVQAVVEDFGNQRAMVRMLADYDVAPDKTIQVWTLPSKETGPVSLGLIEQARSTNLDGPSLPSPRGDQLYEITLEPAGGSPTGRPTGPILAKGLAKLPL